MSSFSHSFRARMLLAMTALLFVLASASAATASAAPLRAPGTILLGGVGPTYASLRWSAVSGASSYEVLRGGAVVGRTSATRFTDRGLRASTYYPYRIRAIGPSGRSPVSDLMPALTHARTSCTRWVSSTAGNDANPGTALAPWRTVQHLADMAGPGTVGCLQGTFVEDVTVREAGTAASKLVIRSAPGTQATIRGRVWIAAGADHVTFSGLLLDGRANSAGGGGLPSPTVNAAHAVFERNVITNRGTRICVVLGSIYGWGRAVLPVLAYNRIQHCGYRAANGTTTNNHHGIYVENALGARIVHNVIWNNADRGIQLYPNAQRSTIARNLIDGNGEGIIFSGAHGYASSGNRVIRNVITNSRIRYDVEHYWEPGSGPGTDNVVIRSCLGGGAQGEMSLPAVGWRSVGTIIGTPAFRDRLRGDFRLVDGVGGRCHSLLRSRVLPLAPS